MSPLTDSDAIEAGASRDRSHSDRRAATTVGSLVARLPGRAARRRSGARAALMGTTSVAAIAAAGALPSTADAASTIVFLCDSERMSVCAVDPDGGPVRTLIAFKQRSAIDIPTVSADGKAYAVTFGYDVGDPVHSRMVTGSTTSTKTVTDPRDTTQLRDLRPPDPDLDFNQVSFVGAGRAFVYSAYRYTGPTTPGLEINQVVQPDGTVTADISTPSMVSDTDRRVGALGTTPWYSRDVFSRTTCFVDPGNLCREVTTPNRLLSGSVTGKYLVTSADSGTNGGIQVIDATTRAVVRTFKTAGYGALSTDGRFVALTLNLKPGAPNSGPEPLAIASVLGDAPPRVIRSQSGALAWGGPTSAAPGASASIGTPASVSGAGLRHGLRVSVKAARGRVVRVRAIVGGKIVATERVVAKGGTTSVHIPLRPTQRKLARRAGSVTLRVQVGRGSPTNRTVRIR